MRPNRDRAHGLGKFFWIQCRFFDSGGNFKGRVFDGDLLVESCHSCGRDFGEICGGHSWTPLADFTRAGHIRLPRLIGGKPARSLCSATAFRISLSPPKQASIVFQTTSNSCQVVNRASALHHILVMILLTFFTGKPLCGFSRRLATRPSR